LKARDDDPVIHRPALRGDGSLCRIRESCGRWWPGTCPRRLASRLHPLTQHRPPLPLIQHRLHLGIDERGTFPGARLHLPPALGRADDRGPSASLDSDPGSWMAATGLNPSPYQNKTTTGLEPGSDSVVLIDVATESARSSPTGGRPSAPVRSANPTVPAKETTMRYR
jgi:hypothetical protein